MAAKQLVDGSVTNVQDVDVSKVQAILTGVFKQIIHANASPRGPKWTDPTLLQRDQRRN